MSGHLSPIEFAKCFVEGPAGPELRHLMECPECRAELDQFRGTVASFRSAIRERVDVQVESAPGIPLAGIRPAARTSGLRWVLAAAVVVLVLLPVFMTEKKSPEVVREATVKMDPDALMDAINLHLLRTVPAPMEPMLALVPSAESEIESGGDR